MWTTGITAYACDVQHYSIDRSKFSTAVVDRSRSIDSVLNLVVVHTKYLVINTKFSSKY